MMTFAPTGASGYHGICNDEELATVDVLDSSETEIGEGNTYADKLAIYSNVVDKAGIDVPVQSDDSGAECVAGCRVAPLINAVLKD